MSQYKTSLPDSFNAGDSIQFAVRAYDLEGNEITNAGGYTAYLILNNGSYLYSGSTTTDVSEGFLFEIPTVTTQSWVAGKYSVSIVADNGANRYQVSKGFTEVKPDLFTVTEHDSRSVARQIRDALEAAILGQASSNQLSMSIAGRSIQRMSLEELITAKQRYDGFVALEDQAQDLIEGKPSKNKIQIRFK